MRDIRLYYYNSGTLRKQSNRKGQHFFNTPEEAHIFINKRVLSKKIYQWVITEYFLNDYSKIIEIL